jgi:hypothetical protein
MSRPPARTQGDTRLDRFLAVKGINKGEFATATGCSRQHVQRVRFGDSEPTVKSIRRFVVAARLLANDASIKANDLFPLDDEDSPR